MKPTNIKFYENSWIIKEMDLHGETYVHYTEAMYDKLGLGKWELVATFYDLSEYSERYSFYKVTLESGEVINIFSDHND